MRRLTEPSAVDAQRRKRQQGAELGCIWTDGVWTVCFRLLASVPSGSREQKD